MTKIFGFIRENWETILAVAFLAVVAGLIIYGIVYMFFIYEPLNEGYVTGKSYQPSRSVYSPQYITINGKTQTISSYRIEPEHWIITVENEDRTDQWYVSEKYYDEVKIGDWVTK